MKDQWSGKTLSSALRAKREAPRRSSNHRPRRASTARLCTDRRLAKPPAPTAAGPYAGRLAEEVEQGGVDQGLPGGQDAQVGDLLEAQVEQAQEAGVPALVAGPGAGPGRSGGRRVL